MSNPFEEFPNPAPPQEEESAEPTLTKAQERLIPLMEAYTVEQLEEPYFRHNFEITLNTFISEADGRSGYMPTDEEVSRQYDELLEYLKNK